MGTSKTLCTKNEDLHERVETYREERGLEYRSDAMEELLRAGLRERRHPLLSRLRERSLVLGEMLAVIGLVFLAGGIVTSAYPVFDGVVMWFVMSFFALAIPGAVELARLVAGQNELGVMVEEVIR